MHLVAMAQFSFEHDLRNVLELYMPITNAQMWQRKAYMSTCETPGDSSQYRSLRTSNDRFIPIRNTKQMEVASFLLSKAHEPAKMGTQKAWSAKLHGFDIEQTKILNISGNPFTAPKVPKPVPAMPRCISPEPDCVLDASDVLNDFYLNLMDWSSRNILAVALYNRVYLKDVPTGSSTPLMKMKAKKYISSVSWSKEGTFLAIGTSDGKVQLWDVNNGKRLRNMVGHMDRVSSLSWSDQLLSSGSKSGNVHHHDIRVKAHCVATLEGHIGEVCGLKWSPDGRFLASGGDDNMVFVWPGVQRNVSLQTPLHSFTDHQGAIKALAWCPWQPNVLASGGGDDDRHIRIWNVSSGSCLSMLDTRSQITSLLFAPNHNELVSSHGINYDNITIWTYPSFDKVTVLRGHENRVLSMALDPNNSTMASLAADERIHMWTCFRKYPVRKPIASSNDILNLTIR